MDGLKNLGTDSFTLSFWVKELDSSSGDPALVSNKAWESGMNPGMTIASENGKFRLSEQNKQVLSTLLLDSLNSVFAVSTDKP